MAKGRKLSPHLPAAPLTAEQRRLFDRYAPLAKKAADWGAKRYGQDHRAVLYSGALTGLMCAAANYKTPSTATFYTFAVKTINWMMSIEFHREVGKRRRREPRSKKPQERFEPSTYRACGELPEITWNWHDEDACVLVSRETPETLMQVAEEAHTAHRILQEATTLVRPRELDMLMQSMEGETLAGIGRQHGISRERVRQLVERARSHIAATTSVQAA